MRVGNVRLLARVDRLFCSIGSGGGDTCGGDDGDEGDGDDGDEGDGDVGDASSE